MANNKIQSYKERARSMEQAQVKEKEALRLKQIELASFKEHIIAEYIRENKKETLGSKVLNIFKTKK